MPGRRPARSRSGKGSRPPASGRILIGTSGYSYRDWKGKFYPERISGPKMLPYYAERFPTVEINYSFYHLPAEKTLERWKGLVPPGFVFTLKASRLITHVRRLLGAEEATGEFLERAAVLGRKLGPVLFQLPPSLRPNLPLLDSFLRLLPRRRRSVVEFRHNSWVTEETFTVLERRRVAYCVVSAPGLVCRWKATAPFAYLRLHGARSWFRSRYSDRELREVAARVKEFASEGREVYVYFNNDFHAYAAENARRLGELVAG